jgi:hypothetical protein
MSSDSCPGACAGRCSHPYSLMWRAGGLYFTSQTALLPHLAYLAREVAGQIYKKWPTCCLPSAGVSVSALMPSMTCSAF